MQGGLDSKGCPIDDQKGLMPSWSFVYVLGLVPRIFEFLFSEIEKKKAECKKARGQVRNCSK